MIKINGVAIATPKVFEATVSDIDGETNRNANGELIRDRVAVKRKINLEWGTLEQSEMSKILNAVSNVFFTVEFPDPQLGLITKTMYVGDRTSPAYSYIDNKIKWQGLKMNFIEK
ncbi:DUF6711 family protein [Clostridium sp.]|uniref:DUF6711 family protein n=1 Tax=Clostridium sp. TaxID=1506 RepID=UPI00290C596B|nr:DUF6711 family protein [Clostridium sp.]MDU3412631.1 DUF6711 family protein [Clostridium sp.]